LTAQSKKIPELSISGRKVAIGAMAGGVVNIIKVALQLLLLPLMARQLGPDEFGLYALALPTVSLVALLADGGLGATLAQEDESLSLVWSSAFWVLLLTGLTLALGSTIFGMLLGYLANQPRLPMMIATLSLSLVFLTLSVVPYARLTRRKHLGIGAGAELASSITGAIVAVVMAFHNAGAWSLVAQYVVTYAVRAIIVNVAVFQSPEAKFSLRALRPHLVTGGILIASRICDYTGRAMENFLVDRIFGTVLLGSYNFANQVSRFATDSASNVVWAALYVQALTEGKDKIIVLHQQLCRLLGVMLFPATFLAAAAAPELINFMLGPKWPDLTFLLRIFLPLYALTSICAQTSPLLLAYGRFEIQFRCVVGLSVGRVLALCLGFWIGLHGAVYGVATVTILFCLAMIVIPAKVIGFRPHLVLLGLVRPAVSSAVATVAFLLFESILAPSVTWTLICLAGGFLVYAMCMLLIDRKGLKEDWNSARRILSPGKVPDMSP
jgi:O-antigen/teichoic acid export membrane protein